MERIDAHQHFWEYDASSPDFAWIGDDMRVIQRSFGPRDLASELERAGIDGSVVVQAPQTLHENQYLLGLAAEHDFVRGVVGWVDLCSPDAGQTLDALVRHEKFKGVRRIVQAEPASILSDPAFLRGIAELTPRNLTYDILIHVDQLGAAVELVQQNPRQRFVLDHLGKPRIAKAEFEPWATQLRILGKLPNAYCKVSGVVTEANWHTWTPSDIEPFLDVTFEAFPTERLMFGSDWPVCLVASSYERVLRVIDDFTRELTPEQRAQVFGGTACEFYGLP